MSEIRRRSSETHLERGPGLYLEPGGGPAVEKEAQRAERSCINCPSGNGVILDRFLFPALRGRIRDETEYEESEVDEWERRHGDSMLQRSRRKSLRSRAGADEEEKESDDAEERRKGDPRRSGRDGVVLRSLGI